MLKGLTLGRWSNIKLILKHKEHKKLINMLEIKLYVFCKKYLKYLGIN